MRNLKLQKGFSERARLRITDRLIISGGLSHLPDGIVPEDLQLALWLAATAYLTPVNQAGCEQTR